MLLENPSHRVQQQGDIRTTVPAVDQVVEAPIVLPGLDGVPRGRAQAFQQVIDDAEGRTLATASTIEKDIRGKLKTGADTAAATAVGQTIAERATKAGVESVVFDRGGYNYHGRIKALADAAREAGLKF